MIERQIHIFPGAGGNAAVGFRTKGELNSRLYHPGFASRTRLNRILLNHTPRMVQVDNDGPSVHYVIPKHPQKGQRVLPFTSKVEVRHRVAA